MRTVSTAISAEFDSEEASGFFLVKIGLASTYHYTDCDIDLTYAGDTYFARGFEVQGIEQSPGFANDSVSVRMDNVDRTFSQIVLSEDAANAPVSLYFSVRGDNAVEIGTFEIYSGFISEWTLSERQMTLKLASEFSFWFKKALRLPTPNCPWSFKGTECGYSGAETLCDKSPTRCSLLGNYAKFGGRKFISDVEEQEIYWGPR